MNYNLQLKAVFLVYVAYLFSSYFEYITESFFLWQYAYVIFILIVPFFVKNILTQKYMLIFLIYILIYQILMSLSDNPHYFNKLSFLQFLIAILFLFSSLRISTMGIQYLERAIYYYKILLYLILIISLLQFILRPIFLELTLSDHQNFRQIGVFYQLTSVFYEPRGLGQFLNVSLFITLFTKIFNRQTTRIAVVIILAILFTFSLGAITVMTVVLGLYFISKASFKSIRLRSLIFIPVAIISFFTILINTPVYENFSYRFSSLFERVENVDTLYLFENAYKMNHVDYYNQYGDDLEEEFGVKGGSEIVSTFGELSYLYKNMKENFLFGVSPSVNERYMTLNFFVEMFSRLGAIGIILLSLIYFKQFYKFPNKIIFIIFIIFLFQVDGSPVKPQMLFLLSLITMAYNYKFIKEKHELYSSSNICKS